MAKVTGTVLTDEHFRVLEFASDYYQKHRIGPLYYILKKNLNITRTDIERLFPNNLKSVYSWVGIPIHSPGNQCKPVPTIQVDDFREVYFDHNATTYIRKPVAKVMSDYYDGELGYGNPSSSTNPGKEAYKLIGDARKTIADCLKVKPNEIVFTGGGSEANNLAIKGIVLGHFPQKGHIITTRIEHASVLNSLKFLEQFGFEVTYLDVNRDGWVEPENLARHLRPSTILVSVMLVNNEIGVINPVVEIGRICREKKIPFMVDAAQAFGKMVIRPKEMGISLLTMSAHKIYGPKGTGALYMDESISLVPLIHGGNQEFGLRSGTENVGSILGFAEAARLIYTDIEKENSRLGKLQNYFLTELRKIVPDFVINGSLENRMPNNLNIGFPGVDSGALLLSLNQIGIYVSAGSACHSGSTEDSHVLLAIGADTKKYGSLRFGFGLTTTQEDIDYFIKYLPMILRKLREGW